MLLSIRYLLESKESRYRSKKIFMRTISFVCTGKEGNLCQKLTEQRVLPRLSEPFHIGHNKIEGSKITLLIKTYTSLHYYYFLKPSKRSFKSSWRIIMASAGLAYTVTRYDLSSRFQTKRSLKITFYCPSRQIRASSVKWQYHSPLAVNWGAKGWRQRQEKVPTRGVTLLRRWWLTFEPVSGAKPKKLPCNDHFESILSSGSPHKQHTHWKDVWINASKDHRSFCDLSKILTFQTENEEVISKDIQTTELCSPKQLFWVYEALLQSNSQMLSAASYLQRESGSQFTNQGIPWSLKVQHKFQYIL